MGAKFVMFSNTLIVVLAIQKIMEHRVRLIHLVAP